MILYVSNKQNENMLDEICEKHEWQFYREVLEDNLNDIIQKQMNIVQTLDYFVLNVCDTPYEQEQLEDIFITIRTVWNGTRIIVIKPMEEAFWYEEDYLYLNEGDNLLMEQLEKALSGEQLQKKREATLIGVVSSHSGAGATYLSMQIVQYIRKVSDSVCYVEANNSGDLGAYARFERFEEIISGTYEQDGITYMRNAIDPSFEYVVCDFGVFNTKNSKMYMGCKELFLISDGMPYRIRDVENVLVHEYMENVRIILNYIDEALFSRIKHDYELMENAFLLPWREPMGIIGDALQEMIPKQEEEKIIPFVKPEIDWKKIIDVKKVFAFIGIVSIGVSAVMGIRIVPDLFNTYGKPIVERMRTTESTEVAKNRVSEQHDENLDMNKDIRISVMEVEGADGYEVCYSTKESFPKEATVVIEVGSAEQVVESLETGNTYYVRVRAFRVGEDGNKVYGEYTEVQKIRL